MSYNAGRIHGFSMIEVMVSLFLVFAILMIVGPQYKRSVRSREIGTAVTGNLRQGNGLIDAIRRDLNRMSTYPGKRTIFFAIKPDRDGQGNRRDTLVFDAMVPVMNEEGLTYYRFGRITYSVEEQLGISDFKKLIRTTVFINDEYTEEDEEADAAADEPRQDTPEDTSEENDEELEEIEVDRDEQSLVLARNVNAFAVDLRNEDGTDWDEVKLSGKVPALVKITLSLKRDPLGTDDEELDPEGHLIEFSNVCMPVMAPHITNKYMPGAQDRDESDKKRDPKKIMEMRK